MMDQSSFLTHWNHKLDQFTLAQAVKEFDDFFEDKKDQFLSNLLDAPDQKRLIEIEIKEIDRIMSHEGGEYFDIPTESEQLEHIRRRANREPVKALPVNHGGSDLVRYGFSRTLDGGNIRIQDLRINGQPYNHMQVFIDSNTPLYFLPKLDNHPIFTSEVHQNGDIWISHQIIWLEGLFYIIRGGNYAFYYSWLKAQLQSLAVSGKLEDEEPATIPPGDLVERILLAHELGLLDAMSNALVSNGIIRRKNSNNFYKLMMHIFRVESFDTIARPIRQTGHPIGSRTSPNEARVYTKENYEAVLNILDNVLRSSGHIVEDIRAKYARLVQKEN